MRAISDQMMESRKDSRPVPRPQLVPLYRIRFFVGRQRVLVIWSSAPLRSHASGRSTAPSQDPAALATRPGEEKRNEAALDSA